MSAESQCPGCGGALSDAVLGGLCPKCLLRPGETENHSASAGRPASAGITLAPGISDVRSALRGTPGSIPQTLLRDTDPGPLVLPGSSEIPADGDRPGRLQLLGEIARGGMGAVLKGRDNQIGRDLAVKVLLERHRDDPDLARRFIEEAQIGGQLQHPGIVPIYELGAFADGRPYFAMKLVKGRTLSSLLDERPDPMRELPRFLSIFELVCQTMAYAHARGVIHRDLKPSNIMVGSFGEVQVMDWGLAKVLPQGGAFDDASAGKAKDLNTVIATARSGSDSDLSRAGSVMGTPAYMAPEQARGEVDRLDERCDVFALGSILAELVTGSPAFTGRSSAEIGRKASRGDVKEATDRLEICGADSELVALAKNCLLPELEDRPRHAGALADRIAAHRTGVEERLRLAEIAGAEDKARAEESARRARLEHHRARLTVALAASLVGLVLFGGGAWSYFSQLKAAARSRTERAVNQALNEANVLFGQAKIAAVGDLSKWPDALAAVNRAKSLLIAGEPSIALRDRVDHLQKIIEHEQAEAIRRDAEAQRDRKLVERLDRIRLERFLLGEKWVPQETDKSYSATFREFAIDVDQLAPVEAGRRLKERSNPLELAFFVDDWALVRLETQAGNSSDAKVPDNWRALIALARAVDPDSWRDSLRSQVGAPDRDVVNRLAVDEKALETQPPRSLVLLAQVLEAQGNTTEAERVLKRAWRRRPDDFWICSQLAKISQKETVRFASDAVALRPEIASARMTLAQTLARLNQPVPFRITTGGAMGWATFVNESPETWALHTEVVRKGFHAIGSENQAQMLDAFFYMISVVHGKPRCEVHNVVPYYFSIDDEIVEQCKEAVRLAPDVSSFHHRLAEVLIHQQERSGEAFAEYRKAIELLPQDPNLRHAYACQLALCGRPDEAIRAYDEAEGVLSAEKEQQSKLPFPAQFHLFAGSLLQKEGKTHAAYSEFRRSLLLAEENLVIVFASFVHAVATPEEEIDALRERLRSHPAESFTISRLGAVLRSQGKSDDEITLYREAIGRKPKLPEIHGFFARVLEAQGKPVESRTEFAEETSLLREVVRQNPEFTDARVKLAEALIDQGKWDEGREELHRAARVDPAKDLTSSLAREFYIRGKVDCTIALYREAVRLNRANDYAHSELGYHSLIFGDTDTALSELREAARMKPNEPGYVSMLACAHLARGELREAATLLRKASRPFDELDVETKARMKHLERLLKLEGNLDAILRGQELIAEPEKKLDVADLCRLTHRFSAAARFYREVFHDKPALAEDLWIEHRIHAAIAAAATGTHSNPANDDTGLRDGERAGWRAQALEWIQAERAACARLIAEWLPENRARARKTLEILIHHRDLAPLRDETKLEQLPEPERKAWRESWSELNALLAKAG
jgi:eukaryotic-like serine/threonine-protein kinase